MIAALDALGNPVRRRLLRLLREEPREVGALHRAIGGTISRPAVSRHLRILREASLVSCEPRGRRNIYRLEARGFESARGELESFWDDALARFKLVAENGPRDANAGKSG
jgi:DNA-binding transcriptional ArsR family regulator